PIKLGLRPAKVDRHVVAVDETGFFQAIAECRYPVNGVDSRRRIEVSDHRQDRLLRSRRERPSGCRAAERDQQLPPSDGDCHTPLPCEVRKGEGYHATSVQSSRSRRAGMLVASTSPADSGRTLEGTDPTGNRSVAGERAHWRRNAGMNLVMTLGVVLAGFWFDAAVAQEGYFGHDHDRWHHGFYQTLERPDTKSPCCNLTDCRPTSGRQVDGHYEVKVNGAWVSVPAGKIRKRTAPDFGFHVCAPFKFDGQPDHLYCVVVPPEI